MANKHFYEFVEQCLIYLHLCGFFFARALLFFRYVLVYVYYVWRLLQFYNRIKPLMICSIFSNKTYCMVVCYENRMNVHSQIISSIHFYCYFGQIHTSFLLTRSQITRLFIPTQVTSCITILLWIHNVFVPFLYNAYPCTFIFYLK